MGNILELVCRLGLCGLFQTGQEVKQIRTASGQDCTVYWELTVLNHKGDVTELALLAETVYASKYKRRVALFCVLQKFALTVQIKGGLSA